MGWSVWIQHQEYFLVLFNARKSALCDCMTEPGSKLMTILVCHCSPDLNLYLISVLPVN